MRQSVVTAKEKKMRNMAAVESNETLSTKVQKRAPALSPDLCEVLQMLDTLEGQFSGGLTLKT